MKRAKKRYEVKFKNKMGSGSLGTFVKKEKAEREIENSKGWDMNQTLQGYPDLCCIYWIEEKVIY